MKKILISFLFALTLFFLFPIESSFGAAAITIPGTTQIENVSLDVGTSSHAIEDVHNIGFRILTIIKRILMGLLVIFMVYIGAMMIMSMGSNEEQLSSSKRQIWYALVALVFINIPGTIYESFYKDSTTTVGNNISTDAFEDASTETTGNLFFDFLVFWNTVSGQIVMFLEVMIFIAAVFMISIAGIQLMTSRGREEKMKEAKTKILYTILALVFVGIIEAWKMLAFGWVIADGVNLFGSLANLALFFAAPVAIFFLSLAAYYFITANGDEERVKKGKNMVVNILLATIILLAAYTFLLELSTL